MLEFEAISLAHKERVESLRIAYGNTLYMYTFTSLFIWQEYEQYEIYLADGAFIIKNGAEGENAYLFPCGSEEGKKRIIDSLLKYEKPVFVSMTNDDKDFLEKAYPQKFSFKECRDEFIYLYDKDEQIELKGKDFKKLRHHINLGRLFAEEWTTEPITENNIGRVYAINEQWEAMKGILSVTDTNASRKAFDNLSELSMSGLIFQADGKDTAYIAGSFITPEIFDLSFCKVLGERCDFFVRWAFYKSLPEETKIIDSEEDLGIEGLRINKLSRHPKELIHIWKGNFNL